MLLIPTIIAALETSLNKVLFRAPGAHSLCMRLAGKNLKIQLKEFSTPLILLFSEKYIDVLSHWDDAVDCSVCTRLSVLPELRDRQKLPQLMRNDDILVEGDIQIIQHFVALLDLVEWDPAEWLSPYIGDIAAEGIVQAFAKSGHLIKNRVIKQQHYLAEAVTEEWKLAPGRLEVAWFCEEVDALKREVDAIAARLDKMENQ